jgi:uncharacterized protein
MLTFAAPDVVQPARWRGLKLIPFHRLHDARYVIYWRVIPPAKYAAERQRVEAEERARLALEAATIDHVVPGNQQSEVDHGFKGERTGNGHHRDRSWRDARGGWFSYELKAPRGEAAELLVTYWGSDRGRRFDVVIDDKKIADVTLENPKSEQFFEVRYPLPAGRAADKVTVNFQAHEGSTAGGVFDVRIVRPGAAR